MRRPAAVRRPKSDPKRTCQRRSLDIARAYLRNAKWQGLLAAAEADDTATEEEVQP
jgi:hypothetical protein